MNRKYVKLFMVIITVLISFFTFLSTRYQYSTVNGISILLSLLFAIPIIMHSKLIIIKDNKQKMIYKIIMCVLYLISFLIIFVLFLEVIISQNDIFIKIDRFREIFSNLLFMTTSWLMLFMGIIDIEQKESKINFVLNIIVLLVVILVHMNYFLNSNLKTLINESMVGEKALYITQNYVYFGFMYVLVILNKFINDNYNL